MTGNGSESQEIPAGPHRQGEQTLWEANLNVYEARDLTKMEGWPESKENDEIRP